MAGGSQDAPLETTPHAVVHAADSRRPSAERKTVDTTGVLARWAGELVGERIFWSQPGLETARFPV